MRILAVFFTWFAALASACTPECDPAGPGDIDVEWLLEETFDPLECTLQQTQPGVLIARTADGEPAAVARFSMPGLVVPTLPANGLIAGVKRSLPDGAEHSFIRVTDEGGRILFAGGAFDSTIDPFGVISLLSDDDAKKCTAVDAGRREERTQASAVVSGAQAEPLVAGTVNSTFAEDGSSVSAVIVENYFFEREAPICINPDCGDGTVFNGSHTRAFIVLDATQRP